jgi:hypothetical protein
MYLGHVLRYLDWFYVLEMLLCCLMCHWTFHTVVGFIICGRNIKINIGEVLKGVLVVLIKRNKVVDYIIEPIEQMKWHVST